MKVKAIVVWWLIRHQEHPKLTPEDKKISTLMPLIQALFPGINYYSSTGFHTVMRRCVIPVLWKQFPGLATTPSANLRPGVMLEVREVMYCDGYEWENAEWEARLKAYLLS